MTRTTASTQTDNIKTLVNEREAADAREGLTANIGLPLLRVGG